MKKIGFLIVLLSCSLTFAQDKIEKSKKALTQESSAKNNTTTSTSSQNTKNVNDGIFTEVAFKIAFGVIYYSMLGDYQHENHLYSNLSKHPYYNGKSGNFEKYAADTIKENEFRLDLEDEFIYNNQNLLGNHLKAKIRPFQYFYLQADYHQLYEKDVFDDSTNSLSLYQFNFAYDRIRFEKFNLGWTLGAVYVANDVQKAGFSYGLNAEYFMGNNISFLGSAKWSKINSQPVNFFEFKPKYHLNNYFFSIGFEHLKIAQPTYNFISLGGGIYF